MSQKQEVELQVPHLSEGVVLNSCGTLVDVQLWPSTATLNPKPWLDNFRRHEQIFARNLLANFLYFSEPLVDRLFAQSFQSISGKIRQTGRPHAEVLTAWQSFCDDLVVTLVQGEEPSPTDSGFLFARKARQVLGLSEDRVVSPESALRAVINGDTQTVLFVDDFVGSGDQFVRTWNRVHGKGNSRVSFRKALETRQFSAFYCNAIATSQGASRIQAECPGVILSTAHILPENYNWLAPDSPLWSQPLRADGPEFVRQASLRAGIPDLPGAVNYWRGYKGLGLGLAFQHSVPDATLPLFYWEQNGWQPLLRRT